MKKVFFFVLILLIAGCAYPSKMMNAAKIGNCDINVGQSSQQIQECLGKPEHIIGGGEYYSYWYGNYSITFQGMQCTKIMFYEQKPDLSKYE
jgi:hypothetical protein